jgi:hypothetical protein
MGMGPGQSHAGITVPEGDPEAVRSMAQTFKGMAGSLERSAYGFGAMPGELSGWQGPASVAFASVAHESGAAATAGSVAFDRKAQAADRLADQLEQAQRDTRQAISDAKDAERRIRVAKREIADARDRRQRALDRVAAADLVIAATDLIATAPAGAYAERDQAKRDADQAEQDQQRAQKALDRAQDDLQDAQRAGRRAQGDAQDATTTAAGAFTALAATPRLAPLPGPANGITTNPTNPFAGIPALVPIRNGTPGSRPTRARDGGSQPTGPSGFDPLFGQDPLTWLGWGVSGGTGGYVNRADGARKTRRAANERLTRASDPSTLTEPDYRKGLSEAERGASESSGAARAASKGLRFAKPLGPVTDLGTGVYDAASGHKGWLRSGIETTGSITGGVLGGLGAGALGIESGPGAFVTGAAGATAGSAGLRGLAGKAADALGIH